MADIGPTSGAGNTPAVIYDFARGRERVEAHRREAATDRSGFTDEARELARARREVDAAGDMRQERVRALKKQIENGEYVPDARDVARKILDRGL